MNKNKKDYPQIFRKIVEYVEKKRNATIRDITTAIFGSESWRVISTFILAFLVYEGVLEYDKIGRAVVFRVGNREKLEEIIKRWQEKIWF